MGVWYVMAKGSQFERDMARLLSKWWTDDKRDDVFWRSAMSGGMATVRARKGETKVNQIGDLVAVDPIGAPLLEAFVIELKRGYKQWAILDLLDSKNTKSAVLHKFIEQVQHECKIAAIKNFLLICKKDKRNPIVITNLKLPIADCIIFYYCNNIYYTYRLEDFLNIPPGIVLGLTTTKKYLDTIELATKIVN